MSKDDGRGWSDKHLRVIGIVGLVIMILCGINCLSIPLLYGDREPTRVSIINRSNQTIIVQEHEVLDYSRTEHVGKKITILPGQTSNGKPDANTDGWAMLPMQTDLYYEVLNNKGKIEAHLRPDSKNAVNNVVLLTYPENVPQLEESQHLQTSNSSL